MVQSSGKEMRTVHYLIIKAREQPKTIEACLKNTGTKVERISWPKYRTLRASVIGVDRNT